MIAILTDPADRRKRLIALTKRGVTKLNEAAEYWRTAQDRFEEVFGGPEAGGASRDVISGRWPPKIWREGIAFLFRNDRWRPGQKEEKS